jgi:hypothetical protein
MEWTEDRLADLSKLEFMLRELSGLKQATYFLDRVEECMQTAKSLSQLDFRRGARLPFTTWLRESIKQEKN